MLTRDLVLRLCATPSEFDGAWLAEGHKVAAPYLARRDAELARTIVEAAYTMGADRLLVCRTRSEHAYDPVSVIPAQAGALIDLVQSWGGEPTDFLVALEDLSGAVLVTAGPLTVAVGPAPFLRTLVGPDIGRARAAFAQRALDGHDSVLMQAATRYGCIEPGARHARTRREPRPDLAERLNNRAAALRERRPGTAAVLRASRALLAWALVVFLAAVVLALPEAQRAAAVFFTLLWLLVQLCLFARSRTVTLSVLMRLVAAGGLMAIPVALAEPALAGVLGMAPADPFAYAYVAVPVEEAAKLVPPLLLWLLARQRVRRFAAVDYLLVGAASGAGFQLVEQGITALVTTPVPVLVPPGVWTLLPGWTDLAQLRFAGHAVTTALICAGVGLAAVGRRRYGLRLWLLPPLLAAVAVLDHMALNAAAAGLDLTEPTQAAHALLGGGHATRWLLLALLVLGVLLDHRAAREVDDVVPPLPGTPPLSALARMTRGLAIRIRARVPGDIAPVFARSARWWAQFPAALTETVVTVLHEFTVALVAASRGPATLFATLRFIRERRELAMAAYRAGQRPRRDVPARVPLWDTTTWLTGALTGTAAVAAAVAAAGILAPSAIRPGGADGSAAAVLSDGGSAAAVPIDGGSAAYLALLVEDLRTWLLPYAPTGYTIAIGASIALVTVLLTGWSPPRDQLTMSGFLRDPRGVLGNALGTVAPGQLGYALLALLGLAVPRGIDTLLVRRRDAARRRTLAAAHRPGELAPHPVTPPDGGSPPSGTYLNTDTPPW
ncbi:protease prsW family protein [Allonocardiopsis opalescens]|uniref:Protease prsW family protein n=2 Tax=Allonocardiopsis opalescens TaxID=1144618 RepID=A0A2T0Q8C2_9ACTN|nr:protease prsW family protein [Allonocardiopsis opalescens]